MRKQIRESLLGLVERTLKKKWSQATCQNSFITVAIKGQSVSICTRSKCQAVGWQSEIFPSPSLQPRAGSTEPAGLGKMQFLLDGCSGLDTPSALSDIPISYEMPKNNSPLCPTMVTIVWIGLPVLEPQDNAAWPLATQNFIFWGQRMTVSSTTGYWNILCFISTEVRSMLLLCL